ncbi:hypothetical protein HG535_0F03690 [Zygotorulaspora mrakii]|uniref:Polyprenal reductase n=1 Tax=Zygotorulaspora mrakii TaxID=42260 RepID=A0A7H9B585_ZYGMR|nr:uncharacterized protein HG535_0F03690 [Zygotorulaspora mrakii]QLG73858.1 hypothetical protein HG535_0F03690 [Zygotorulaspora mrakii]
MEVGNALQYLLIGYKISFIAGLLCLVIAKCFLPEFLQYGKTLSARAEERDGRLISLSGLVYLTMPKSSFSHFYYLSSALSIITLTTYPRSSLTWLILLHSLRRLYETKYVSKYAAHSRMNWSHYVVGLWFYASLHLILNAKLASNSIPVSLNPVATLIFLMASIEQYKNHHILSNLTKYSLPEKGMFTIVCCPHYLDEILIYVSLVVYNREFAWPLIWVALTLTTSALETQKYYNAKFKDTNRIPSYAIVPYVV